MKRGSYRLMNSMDQYFLKFKENLELDPTFRQKITTRHSAVREYLRNNHPGFRDSKLIGSQQRQTRIAKPAGEPCDIDILVIMGEFSNWVREGGVSPQAALDALNVTIQDSARYNSMEPVADAPTITLTATDNLQVQLVPGYVDNIGRDTAGNMLGVIGRGYWVAKDGKWEMADYDHEAEWVSQQNQAASGYLIPSIKMLKAIKGNLFRVMPSFALEILAGHIIPSLTAYNDLHSLPTTYEGLLSDFFALAVRHLSEPLRVPQSKSSAMSLDQVSFLTNRFNAIVSFISATARLTNEREKAANWRRLAGEQFPLAID